MVICLDFWTRNGLRVEDRKQGMDHIFIFSDREKPPGDVVGSGLDGFFHGILWMEVSRGCLFKTWTWICWKMLKKKGVSWGVNYKKTHFVWLRICLVDFISFFFLRPYNFGNRSGSPPKVWILSKSGAIKGALLMKKHRKFCVFCFAFGNTIT